MKSLTILGILALFLLLVLPGAVSAANTAEVSGSIAQPAPVAAFTASPLTNSWVIGAAPLAVSFTDQSTVTIGTIDSWKWEYNAGSGWVEFSTVKNPSYTFTTPGAYDIRLTATNGGGSSTATKTHFVAVAFERDPLGTITSGTVSGDLYFVSTSPWPATEATQAFTLPAEAIGNIQWARVFVNDYSGSGGNNWFVKLTTEIDANGDGDYVDAGEVLGVETGDLQSETNEHAYPLNNHVMKVYSDYEAWYDVTGMITSATPSIHVKAEAVTDPAGSMGFDGRIKAITLVVAYNDGDSDQVKYIVNHGNDWMTGSGSTAFDASSFGSGWSDAVVKSVAHSSTDAIYTFNAGSPTKTTLGTNSYWKYNSFDVNSLLTSASNTFGYTAAGSSFKICTAALTAKYTAPTAAFSGTPLTGDTPLTVAFTDESTGAPTAWAWDFNNDGTTDSTAQSPSYTYDTPGIYTVKLTVSNALGSDEELKTNYVTVKTPAPTADFIYTPASGSAPLAVAFTSTSTGVINSYAWDFNNDGTTDSTDQNPSYTYTASGTYSVKLMVTGPDYSDEEVKSNIISVGVPVISVDITPAGIDFGSMAAGTDETGSTAVAVTTDGGTAWSVTGAASNGGYMGTGSANLAAPFQLANGSGSFQAMTSNFAGFMTGMANEDRTDTANVKQAIGTGDQPGSYSITLTFTGAFV